MKKGCSIFLLLLCKVVFCNAQESSTIKSVKEVDAGLGFKNKVVEFYEKGNKGYNDILQNNQRSNINSSRANVYISGGITVENDPPGWTRSKSKTKPNRTMARDRQIRNAQIEQYNQKVREYNRMIEEQRRIEEERREAERREREKIEYERKYNAEYSRVLIQTEKKFNQQVDFALQQRENMKVLRTAKIDDLAAYSGYVPSEGQTVKSKPRRNTSIAGIVSKSNGNVGLQGRIPNAAHINSTISLTNTDNFPEERVVIRLENRPEGDPLGNALFYSQKGVEASTLGETMAYQRKAVWAMSEAIIGNSGMPQNINVDLRKQVEYAIRKQQKERALQDMDKIKQNTGMLTPEEQKEFKKIEDNLKEIQANRNINRHQMPNQQQSETNHHNNSEQANPTTSNKSRQDKNNTKSLPEEDLGPLYKRIAELKEQIKVRMSKKQ